MVSYCFDADKHMTHLFVFLCTAAIEYIFIKCPGLDKFTLSEAKVAHKCLLYNQQMTKELGGEWQTSSLAHVQLDVI